MALLGEFVEHARAGGPLAGLGLGAAFQLHLAEQDIAELLRASGIELRIARKLAHLVLQRGAALREFARKAREHLPVDRNAAPLHALEHWQQRTFQRFVNGGHVLGDHARAKHLRQAQRDVGILDDIRCGLVVFDVIERDLRLAGADHVVVVDCRVAEVARRECVEAVAEAPGIERVGHQHGVLDPAQRDPAHGEQLHLELQVLPDLEHAPVFQQRLQRGERVGLRDLSLREPAAEQPVAVARLAVRERHVARLVRRERQRDAAQRRLHRVFADRLGIERDHAGVVGARDPRLEALEVEHDLVGRAVDLHLARLFQPRGRKRLRCDRDRGIDRRAGARLCRHAAAA